MDATFMTGLKIAHVRHLKDIQILLSSDERRTLILTGKNGSGKTSVLEAIKDFLQFATSSNFHMESECRSGIVSCEKRIETKDETEKGRIESERVGQSLEIWQSMLRHWTDGAVVEFSSYSNLRDKYRNGDFILAYYGDKREVQVQKVKNIEKVNLKPVYSLADHPSQQLEKYLVDLKTTEAFATTNDKPERAREIKNWFSRFLKILRTIYEDNSLTLDFNIDTFQFTINVSGRDPFNFNTMSMGYAAIFDIVSDLIMRMESKGRRQYDLEGLVLIDEIETHLHVELQKKIVPILMDLFPNLQFVLTTHSPFILNSTPKAIIFDLETGTLVKDGLTDTPYDGIVEGYFGADLLSQELRAKFEEYKSLVQKPELTNADFAKAAELEVYLDEVPDYLAWDFSSEYSRLKLELSKRG